METELLFDFEKMLDEEAKRIIEELKIICKKKIKVNKSYYELIREKIKPEYVYYTTDISLRALKFIPEDYEVDQSNEYALVTKEQGLINHLLKYSEFCEKEEKMDKNHKAAANKMADILIEKYQNNDKTNMATLLSDNINELLPRHNDSVDARAIVLFLQQEIENKGYKVTSLNPFIIKEIN